MEILFYVRCLQMYLVDQLCKQNKTKKNLDEEKIKGKKINKSKKKKLK